MLNPAQSLCEAVELARGLVKSPRGLAELRRGLADLLRDAAESLRNAAGSLRGDAEFVFNIARWLRNYIASILTKKSEC